MTTTLHERSGLPGGAGNGWWPEPPGFLSAYPGYRNTALLDRLRATEFSYLDAGGHIYLDYTGAGLVPQAQLAAHAERIRGGCFGNPHSENPASAASTELVERARLAILAHFNASPEEYAAIFTANATGACRLVGEAYPFGPRTRLVLTQDNHNSVNGIREFARARGAVTQYVPFSSPELRIDDDAIRQALARPGPGRLGAAWQVARCGVTRPPARGAAAGRRRGLLAYPAQSNFSGVQHPLRWIQTAHEHGYDVLLDAAAYVPSNRLDLSVVKPDFVPVSWYKVFGYPTGVGCLIARREALGRLRRPWFAGGSVYVASVVQADWHTLATDEAQFEDGTVSFLQIPDLESGLSWVNGIRMDLIHRRVMCLTGWLIGRLAALRHGNGEPMTRIYGPASTRARGGTVAFNLLDPGGRVVDERAVARDTAAVGISIRTGCFCNPGAVEGAFGLTKADWRTALRGRARTLDEYLGLLGMPSGGALRASVGMASNIGDVERFVAFVEMTYRDRMVGADGLAPRRGCLATAYRSTSITPTRAPRSAVSRAASQPRRATKDNKRQEIRRNPMAKVVSARAADQPAAAIGTDVIYRKLFDSFNPGQDGRISHWEVLSRLQRSGLQPDDPRVAEALAGLKAADGASRQIGFQQFKALVKHNSSLIRRAVEGNLAVPDFSALTSDIDRTYAELIPVKSGAVADYIPQLARVNPEQLAIAVCTVDGQRFSVGDATTMFCLQSVSKMVSYCLALDEHGTEGVHRHVGREPSGRSFNELALNPKGLPHNPMVNAGAIMTASLIRPDLDIADRFDHVAATWRRLTGGARPGFNNAVYLSERTTADRNFALGYSMRESGAFRPGTDLLATLEFYFQGCSIEVDAQMLAVAAASLANAGVCPLTEDPVFTPGTVQSCLSLMSSCGMYDFSGEFAFSIGLPAKSGVSGAVMLVIPGLMGICVWSPRLDEHGNSVRGIEFCRRLAAAYNVHVFDSLHAGRGPAGKRDPRRKKNQTQIEGVVALTWAASQGDLDEVRALLAAGVEPGTADYDGRTPLHLAAAEGQLDVVRYLLDVGARPQPADRWGGTPLSDAEGNGHTHVAELIRQAAQPAERKVAI